MADGVELLQVLELVAKYPAATLLFAAWPMLFVALLFWTMREASRREERLIAANERWQAAVERLGEAVEHLAGRVERLEDAVARRGAS